MALITCSECNSQVSDKAATCPKCGAPVTAVAKAGPVADVTSQLKMRPAFKVIGGIIVVLFGAGAVYNLLQGRQLFGGARFNDATIESIKQDIRTKLGERGGVTVEDVQMMAESPRKLTGFAKIKVVLLGEMTKSCSATMSDEGQTMWECR